MANNKKLGVTGEDLNASLLANSPLVSVEVVERRWYLEAGPVDWFYKGHMSGLAYNYIRMLARMSAERLSDMFDEVQNLQGDEQWTERSQAIIDLILDKSFIQFSSPYHMVVLDDEDGYTATSFVSCNFKLISPVAPVLSDLFDWDSIS